MTIRCCSGYGCMCSGFASVVRSSLRYPPIAAIDPACFLSPSTLATALNASLISCSGCVLCISSISSFFAASTSGDMIMRSGCHATETYVSVSFACCSRDCTSIRVYPDTLVSSVPRWFFNCVLSNVPYPNADVKSLKSILGLSIPYNK